MGYSEREKVGKGQDWKLRFSNWTLAICAKVTGVPNIGIPTWLSLLRPICLYVEIDGAVVPLGTIYHQIINVEGRLTLFMNFKLSDLIQNSKSSWCLKISKSCLQNHGPNFRYCHRWVFDDFQPLLLVHVPTPRIRNHWVRNRPWPRSCRTWMIT